MGNELVFHSDNRLTFYGETLQADYDLYPLYTTLWQFLQALGMPGLTFRDLSQYPALIFQQPPASQSVDAAGFALTVIDTWCETAIAAARTDLQTIGTIATIQTHCGLLASRIYAKPEILIKKPDYHKASIPVNQEALYLYYTKGTPNRNGSQRDRSIYNLFNQWAKKDYRTKPGGNLKAKTKLHHLKQVKIRLQNERNKKAVNQCNQDIQALEINSINL